MENNLVTVADFKVHLMNDNQFWRVRFAPHCIEVSKIYDKILQHLYMHSDELFDGDLGTFEIGDFECDVQKNENPRLPIDYMVSVVMEFRRPEIPTIENMAKKRRFDEMDTDPNLVATESKLQSLALHSKVMPAKRIERSCSVLGAAQRLQRTTSMANVSTVDKPTTQMTRTQSVSDISKGAKLNTTAGNKNSASTSSALKINGDWEALKTKLHFAAFVGKNRSYLDADYLVKKKHYLNNPINVKPWDPKDINTRKQRHSILDEIFPLADELNAMYAMLKKMTADDVDLKNVDEKTRTMVAYCTFFQTKAYYVTRYVAAVYDETINNVMQMLHTHGYE